MVRQMAFAGLLALVVLLASCSNSVVQLPPITAAVGLTPLPGFGEGAIVIDGEPLPVMIADTKKLRSQGLMSVTGLGAWAGMVFVFDGPTDGGFWMRHTLMPLTIFWFDDAGLVVGTANMVPCPDTVKDCPRWRPGAIYTHALEVPTATAAALGITSESILRLEGTPTGT
jgi:uncharacterized membrane protein (UPF0127 family)